MLVIVKQLKLPHRQKKNLYPLVTISRDPIIYKNGIILFKIVLVKLKLKGKRNVMLFNVLLLRKDKAVLEMPFLWKYNLKINWVIKNIEF